MVDVNEDKDHFLNNEIDSGPDKKEQPAGNPEAVKLQDDVKESIKVKQAGGEIRTRVVDALVEEEVGVRANLLTKALAKREAQAKELDNIKPDQCTFNEDGTPATEHWSKPKLAERAKAAKALNKIDQAINAAINNADYEGVKKCAQG